MPKLCGQGNRNRVEPADNGKKDVTYEDSVTEITWGQNRDAVSD